MDCLTQQEIADAIGVPRTTIEGWLTDSDWQSDFVKAPDSRQHFDMAEVAERYGYNDKTIQRLKIEVSDTIAEFTENAKVGDIGIFRNFDDEKSDRRIYTIWKQYRAGIERVKISSYTKWTLIPKTNRHHS